MVDIYLQINNEFEGFNNNLLWLQCMDREGVRVLASENSLPKG